MNESEILLNAAKEGVPFRDLVASTALVERSPNYCLLCGTQPAGMLLFERQRLCMAHVASRFKLKGLKEVRYRVLREGRLQPVVS